MSHLPHEIETDEDRKRQAGDRRSATLLLIDMAIGAVDLVTLAAMIELDEELDQLAATSPERQRAVEAARQLLQLSGTPVSKETPAP